MHQKGFATLLALLISVAILAVVMVMVINTLLNRTTVTTEQTEGNPNIPTGQGQQLIDNAQDAVNKAQEQSKQNQQIEVE